MSDNTRIKIFFRGLIVAFVPEGGPFAELGLLRNVPRGHNLCMEVFREDAGGSPESVLYFDDTTTPIPSFLNLEVRDTSQTTVDANRPSRPMFDRTNNGGGADHYGWVIDFADFFPGRRFNVDPREFRSVVRLQCARFHNVCKSICRAKIKTRITQPQRFGKVAMITGAEIRLDRPDSEARLVYDGNQFPFEKADNRTYHIVIDRGRPVTGSQECHSHDTDDFRHYYQAIRPIGVPDDDLIDLETDTSGEHKGRECIRELPNINLTCSDALRTDPDVRCTIGGVGGASGISSLSGRE